MDALSDVEIEQLITTIVKNNPSVLEPNEKYRFSSDMSDAEIAERINIGRASFVHLELVHQQRRMRFRPLVDEIM